jgi:hypothetical protein
MRQLPGTMRFPRRDFQEGHTFPSHGRENLSKRTGLRLSTADHGARHPTDCSNAVGSSDHGLFRGCRQRPIHGERVGKIASSEQAVGEFWETQVSEVVIKGGFVGVWGSKAGGFSGQGPIMGPPGAGQRNVVSTPLKVVHRR